MPRPRKPTSEKAIPVHTTLKQPLHEAALSQGIRFSDGLELGINQLLAADPDFARIQEVKEIANIEAEVQKKKMEFEEKHGEDYEQANESIKSKLAQAEKIKADERAKLDATREDLEMKVFHLMIIGKRDPNNWEGVDWFESAWYEDFKKEGWKGTPTEVMLKLKSKGEARGWK